MISLVVGLAFVGLAGTSTSQPAPSTALSSNSLPREIVTADGTVYREVRLSRIEPDGLLVEYQPATGGIGMGKLKFARLPASLQKQFGYDPLKASAFEHEQARATAALSQKLRQDEKNRMAMLNEVSQRPNLNGTVSVNSSDPAVSYAFYPPGQKPDEVGEYTAVTEPRFTCHADFTFHSQPDAPEKPVRLVVDTVTISLGLSCHLIEPEHPFDFVSRHEEGHRRINEYFYRFGPRVADDIGKSMIGCEFASSATNLDAAIAQVLPQAQFMVEGEYVSHIEGPCRAANRYYDQLQDAEGVHLDVDPAVQKAIARYSDQVDRPIQMPAGPTPFPRNPFGLPPAFQETSSSPE